MELHQTQTTTTPTPPAPPPSPQGIDLAALIGTDSLTEADTSQQSAKERALKEKSEQETLNLLHTIQETLDKISKDLFSLGLAREAAQPIEEGHLGAIKADFRLQNHNHASFQEITA